MPAQDTSQIKEKIVSFIKRTGPSLPVHIAKEAGLSILFASAFLSEILSEKIIKTSNMRIGSSALYFVPGQEKMLERFAHHLKSKEKEAFNLLKEKGTLKDSEQEPAIRVAIREIKDFAIPFRKSGSEDLEWRFFNVPEKEREILPEFPKIQEEPQGESQQQKRGEAPQKILKVQEELPREVQSKQNQELGIFDNSIENPKVQKVRKPKKKNSQKENNFFMKVKESLVKKSIELSDILVFNKNEIILRVQERGNEKILVAYNKRRISEGDIIKASKRAEEFDNLPYIILNTGTPLKRTGDLLKAIKNLSSIEEIE